MKEGRDENIGRVLRNKKKTDFNYANFSQQNSITSLKTRICSITVMTTQYLTKCTSGCHIDVNTRRGSFVTFVFTNT
jgi:hypothetical protein